jgi:trigger factor
LFDNRTLIEVGAEGSHAVFNEHLPGKKAGEVVEFDANYAEDYPEKSLAGKRIHYQVRIETVNQKRMANVDDEFAKDLGNFTSLADLKEKIKQDILNQKKSDQRTGWKDELLKQLIEANPFEVPEGLVRKETESLLKEYAYSLHQRGANLQDPSINWQEARTRLAEQAERNIRGSILVETISDSEKIEVNEEDIDRSIRQMAEQQRRAPEALKAELVKEEKLDVLKNRIRVSKTLDFLVDHATIKGV